MRVTFRNKTFIAICNFHSRSIVKDAGFGWNPFLHKWYTHSHSIAARLREYCDDTAKKELARVSITQTPWAGAIESPLRTTLFPFQEKAIRWAIERNKSYLGLDPGLGKTICAVAIARMLAIPTVYICPPFLVKNVQNEWNTRSDWDSSFYIFPDSKLISDKSRKLLNEFLNRNPSKEKLLIVDEAHRFKNPTAKRTAVLLQKVMGHFSRVVFMSGTPMPNRPMELFSILDAAAPDTIDFMTRHQFGVKYCQAHQNQYGWDYTGAQNVPELAERVKKTFLLRIKKKDVLPELPPKIESIIFLNGKLPSKIFEMDRKVLATHSPEDLMKGEIGEEHIASYRRELGILKVESTAVYLQSLLEETDEKILVFAIHKEPIAELARELAAYDPLVITGAVGVGTRQEIVDKFQTQEAHRILILNIQSGGTGFNLTMANRVVFLEFAWTDADNQQASDRAHRIGQRDSVLVNYMVYENSVDRKVLEVALKKRKLGESV